jgi:pimeloyl-ACP methyl ester carboxylesterase
MSAPEIGERRVPVGEVTLNVAEAGPADGRPVLLLHGFPDSWRLWRHQIASLAAAGYRVVAPDLRGFGASDRPGEVGAYAMRELVGDVAGLLDALGIRKAAVAGHDWGAALAWAVARFLPERVERLAVVSVGHGLTAYAAGMLQRRLSWYMLWFQLPGAAERVLPANDWAVFRDWAWAGAERGSDPDMERQIADLARPGALEAGLNWYRANLPPERYVPYGPPGPEHVAASSVACPVMGVWSSGDFALSEAQMTGSAAFVTGPWRYERIEGVSHWVPVHAPERLSELLLDFLSP